MKQARVDWVRVFKSFSIHYDDMGYTVNYIAL